MADYISREQAIKAISEDIMGGLNYERILRELSAADVRENVHGEWLPHKTKHYDLWECSICHSAALLDQFGMMERSAYCPYCGAKMEVEE